MNQLAENSFDLKLKSDARYFIQMDRLVSVNCTASVIALIALSINSYLFYLHAFDVTFTGIYQNTIKNAFMKWSLELN